MDRKMTEEAQRIFLTILWHNWYVLNINLGHKEFYMQLQGEESVEIYF